MSTTHEVTKLLEKALREFAPELRKEPAVSDSVYALIEALDTDLEALEYGQSDEVGDKMAALEAAIVEANEPVDEEEKVVKEKDEDDEPNDDDDEPEEEDDTPDDDD